MKDVLIFILGVAIISPCLLIINESDTFVPNIIGLCYAFVLLCISRRPIAKRILRRYLLMLKRTDNFIEKWIKN